MRTRLATVLTVFGLAAAGCGEITPRDPDDVDGGAVDDDGGGGTSVDAGPCAACAADAICDPVAADPCTCRPGHAGDGTTCVAVVPELHGARLEVPCSPPSVPGMDGCTSLVPPAWTTAAAGDAGVTYRVAIRVRGVLEHKLYDGGEGEGEFRTGGVPDATTWNVYRLQVGDAVHHLNAGEPSVRHCFAVDYRAEIAVRAGDEISLAEVDTDGLMIVNIDDRDPPMPIVVSDVAPYPDAFDGQFLQIDVESVEPGP